MRANDWQTVDNNLRSIAQRRSALDAEEAKWLREADRLEIWKKLHMVNALDYLEKVLCYTPKVARERMRVALKLGALPVIEAAFARGELSYSHVRELSRIVIASTDAVWCAAAIGRTVGDVQKDVADREVGDLPSDPKKPHVRRRTITLEVNPEVYARFLETARKLSQQANMRIDDDQLVTMLCDAADAPAGASRSPKHMIGMIICERCDQGWQDGGGQRIPVGATAIEKAECDAMHLGPIDGVAPQRATSDITPSVRRLVWLRDQGRCQEPGCRSTVGIDLHHLIARIMGGSHRPINVTSRCSAHHHAHHEGYDDRLGMLHSALRNMQWSIPKVEATLKAIAPHVGHRTFAELLEEILVGEGTNLIDAGFAFEADD